MVLAFFAGAFLASVVVESAALGQPSRAYAAALALEGALLGAFAVSSMLLGPSGPRQRDAEALLLCFAMGMQNSLVTRLSGAVVRTTHLTGMVTDLGIEAARWFRHGRGLAAARLGVPLVVGKNAVERPLVPKTLLLLTIAGAFVAGAALGAALVVRWTHATMGLASLAVLLFAGYAASSARDRKDEVVNSRKCGGGRGDAGRSTPGARPPATKAPGAPTRAARPPGRKKTSRALRPKRGPGRRHRADGQRAAGDRGPHGRRRPSRGRGAGACPHHVLQ